MRFGILDTQRDDLIKMQFVFSFPTNVFTQAIFFTKLSLTMKNEIDKLGKNLKEER